jgi:hypothetical protein
MIINNWYWHGEYQWSGLRTLYCTEGSRWSLHRLAKAADIKCEIPADEMRKEIIKHQDDPLLKWINRMEDKKDWLHVDRANIEGRIILF